MIERRSAISAEAASGLKRALLSCALRAESSRRRRAIACPSLRAGDLVRLGASYWASTDLAGINGQTAVLDRHPTGRRARVLSLGLRMAAQGPIRTEITKTMQPPARLGAGETCGNYGAKRPIRPPPQRSLPAKPAPFASRPRDKCGSRWSRRLHALKRRYRKGNARDWRDRPPSLRG